VIDRSLRRRCPGRGGSVDDLLSADGGAARACATSTRSGTATSSSLASWRALPHGPLHPRPSIPSEEPSCRPSTTNPPLLSGPTPPPTASRRSAPRPVGDRSCGPGAHGPREYWWARVPIRVFWRPGRGHWLLARRNMSTGLLRRLRASQDRLLDLARIAGTRWAVEDASSRPRTPPVWMSTRSAIGGLVCPHHPVDGRARGSSSPNPDYKRGTRDSRCMMIGYTVPEIRRLLAALTVRPRPHKHIWWWSR
jgi:hypothetical protein